MSALNELLAEDRKYAVGTKNKLYLNKVVKAEEELATMKARIAELEAENLHIFLDRTNRVCTCRHPYKSHQRFCDHDECDLCDSEEPCSEFTDDEIRRDATEWHDDPNLEEITE